MPKKRQPQDKPVDPSPRAVERPNYLMRFTPAFQTPQWQQANMWRRLVRQQPIAIACRDTLIAFLMGSDWQIRARNPNDTEKYKTDIDYYMELFNSMSGMEFDAFTDILAQDILDTPFGGGAEVGRIGDDPDGRVVWAQHIDSATLYPTQDFDFPVAQRVEGATWPTVLFPRHAINRAYLSPRPEWQYKGWGMPPPEKIYLAIELLFRGDRYYANLLLDTPEAGILDLLDMDKASAFEWLDSFNQLFTGIDPFKVPILYEHNAPAKWIPFGRPPTELMFDSVTFKYAQLVCAGYGMHISDIGLSAGDAQTLAGVIRAERQTRRSGFAAVKSKTTGFYCRLLPSYLIFEWLDQDDESMLARGRSRLANFQAYAEAREKKMLTLQEIRGQIAADGLLDIQIDPDDPEAEAELNADPTMGPDAKRLPRTSDRDRVPPSDGGQGELTFPKKSFAYLIPNTIHDIEKSVSDIRLRRLGKAMARELFPHASKVLKIIPETDVLDWAEGMMLAVFNQEDLDKKEKKAFEKRMQILDTHLDADKWWEIDSSAEMKEPMTQAYMVGNELASTVAIRALYEDGRRDSPTYLPGTVDLPVDISIVPLVEAFNAQTRDLIKATTFSVICRAFAIPTVYQTIIAGEDVQTLFTDNDFMQFLVAELRGAISEVFESRTTLLADQITRSLVERSVSDFFGQIGLKKGEWVLENGKLTLDETKLLTISERKGFTL